MKLLTFLFFGLIFGNAFSQKDREKILANFDYVDYYPDSTIRSAHKFTGTSLERFTVEFNEIGMPVAMGKYKMGKRIDEWIYSDGSLTIFPDIKMEFYSNRVIIVPEHTRTGNLHPGCGTGRMQAQQEFRDKYQHLIDPEGKDSQRKNKSN